MDHSSRTRPRRPEASPICEAGEAGIAAVGVILTLSVGNYGLALRLWEKFVTTLRRRLLDRLGLEAQASVLQPEQNTCVVFTLSHEQVRKPINNSSIGRWENYAWAFDSAWDSLAAAHDARRGR